MEKKTLKRMHTFFSLLFGKRIDVSLKSGLHTATPINTEKITEYKVANPDFKQKEKKFGLAVGREYKAVQLIGTKEKIYIVKNLHPFPN